MHYLLLIYLMKLPSWFMTNTGTWTDDWSKAFRGSTWCLGHHRAMLISWVPNWAARSVIVCRKMSVWTFCWVPPPLPSLCKQAGLGGAYRGAPCSPAGCHLASQARLCKRHSQHRPLSVRNKAGKRSNKRGEKRRKMAKERFWVSRSEVATNPGLSEGLEKYLNARKCLNTQKKA